MTFFISLLPLIYLVLNSQFNENIINTFQYLIIGTGHIVIFYLLIILFIPMIDQLKILINRKALGISTFMYSLIHFFLYMFENNSELLILLDDIKFREYIQIGYIALFLFFPLVLTSNEFSKIFLKKYWKEIHKIIYIIIFLSLSHYYLTIKADYFILQLYIVLFIAVVFLKFTKSFKNE